MTSDSFHRVKGEPYRMQQSVQVNQPAQQVLGEAASFLAKRRAKITDRSERGFRFGLEGSGADDGGRVTVASGRGGSSTVTVEANGLGVLAMAEGYVRELRKQSKSQPRTQDRAAGGFADLRQRLGMPPAEQATRPPRSQGGLPPRGERPPRPAVPPATPGPGTPAADAAADAVSTDVTGATALSTAETRAAVGSDRPDGPAPAEASRISPTTGPQSTPVPADAPVQAPHPAHVGPPSDTPGRAPAHENLNTAPPSAEQIGGVPAAADAADARGETASGAAG